MLSSTCRKKFGRNIVLFSFVMKMFIKTRIHVTYEVHNILEDIVRKYESKNILCNLNRYKMEDEVGDIELV